ncbi:potassium-transporting ATPase subunit F [Corynebacterium aquilae]|nr:potassium-transporting ATPase subunit F [Corynebacterium aquilae]
MNLEAIVGAVLGIIAIIYVFMALLNPERFS